MDLRATNTVTSLLAGKAESLLLENAMIDTGIKAD
jgi:hypothetical protein